MDLVIKVEHFPPSKADWHNPDPASRQGWSPIFEMITTWFCSSHDFNHADNIFIIYQDYAIKLEGQTIRYLGPSLRSAASLVSKAFAEIENITQNRIIESTPGIFVSHQSEVEFQQPFYYLVPGTQRSKHPPQEGTLFTYINDKSQEYYVPGSRIAQGLVWYLQERSL